MSGKALRVVSLFAGVGGFDLAFDRAGFEIVAHVEKDANCRKLLAARWPAAVALDDVCTAGAHNLPACDVITFGFPCQDLSVAGKRAGLAGGRSGLYYEATRIINELRPAYCLFENVPGLLSSDNGRDFARVLMEMDRIGYHGAWRVLDAQWLGVAQRRRRVFGLFSCVDSGAARCAEVLSIRESLRGHPAPRREAGEGTTRSVAHCLRNGGNLRHREDCDTLIPAVSPTLLGGNNRTGGTRRPGENGVDDVTGLIPIDMRQASRGEKETNNRTKQSGGPCGVGVGVEGDPAFTVSERGQAVAFQPRYFTRDNKTGGAPSETTDITNCAKAGDSAPCVAFGGDVARTLNARHDSSPCADRGMDVVTSGMSVRRLTPTECERLQGFPDGHTANFSDSTRYRMMGNAVCVNVAYWIARRLKAEMEAAR
jgi:DNA (cytosine-5)-methyltransferase 1